MTSPSPLPQPGPQQPWSTQPGGWVPPPAPPGGYRPLLAPLAPNGQPLASFGDRLLAFLLDAVVATVVSLIVTVPLMIVWMFSFVAIMEEQSTGYGSEPTPAEFWAIMGPMLLFVAAVVAVQLIFTYLYYVEYQLRQNGQTVGKKVMKLRVIRVQPTEALTRGDLTKRWGVERVVGVFVPFFSYLDGFWQLWDKPLQQCLHDKAAQTVVVKVG